MDEVDGMSRGDRGGIGALAGIIKTCAFPIICIANERSLKIRSLASCCLDVRFARPMRTVIARALMETVIRDQRLPVKASELETLCERNGNDIRSILNFLQFSCGSVSVPASVVASDCGKDELLRVDSFSAAGRLFGPAAKSLGLDYRSNLVFIDFGMIPLMVAEGYIGASAKSGYASDDERLRCCIQSADSIGDWDIIDTRLRKTQAWNLLPSATMAVVTAGVRAGGSAPFQIFPSWLGKNSKRLKNLRNLYDMRSRMGASMSSRDSLLDSLDLLRRTLFTPGSAEEIVRRLVDYGLTRDDMLETLADLTFPGSEIEMDGKVKSAITREWKKRHTEDVKKGTCDRDREESVADADADADAGANADEDDLESVDFVLD
jgi:replication factor C subunit 1